MPDLGNPNSSDSQQHRDRLDQSQLDSNSVNSDLDGTVGVGMDVDAASTREFGADDASDTKLELDDTRTAQEDMAARDDNPVGRSNDAIFGDIMYPRTAAFGDAYTPFRHGDDWAEIPNHLEATATSAPGFRGIGPKGYRRDDERIMHDVCDVLTHNHEIDPSDIEVKVDDGVVMLDGTVATRDMIRVAYVLIERIPGVREAKVNLSARSGEAGGGASGAGNETMI